MHGNTGAIGRIRKRGATVSADTYCKALVLLGVGMFAGIPSGIAIKAYVVAAVLLNFAVLFGSRRPASAGREMRSEGNGQDS